MAAVRAREGAIIYLTTNSRIGADREVLVSTRSRGRLLPAPVTIAADALWGRADVGTLVTPAGAVRRTLPRFSHWAADTGCYARPAAFDADAYVTWLGSLLENQTTCLFATAPDRVGDWEATWAVARPVLARIRALGYPAALVAQDGMADLPAPDEWDALFVGGTTGWKLSETAYRLQREAKALGKWTHLGRVNSWRRISAAAQAGYDSADGTLLAFNPGVYGRDIVRWLDRLRSQPHLGLFEGASLNEGEG